MKETFLFQVYDNFGDTTITGLIPANNLLTAGIGFYKAYIQEKDPLKNPFKYKALDLICVGRYETDDNGLVVKIESCNKKYKGEDIPKIVQDEMAARGVDDPLDAKDIKE